jgi:hypothetical protein
MWDVSPTVPLEDEMKRFFVFSLCLALPFIAAPKAADEPTPEPAALTCRISAPATCELGKAPDVTIKITNHTGRAIYLCNSLDGSDSKMRFPHVYFEVIGPNGQSSVRGYGRCGNTNPLRTQDFVKVAANATFNPIGDRKGFGAHQLRAQNFSEPGKYRIRFVYSTEAPALTHWDGTPRSGNPLAANLEAMIKTAPKVTLRSNEIVVEVKKAK